MEKNSPELSRRIIDCAFDVYRVIGPLQSEGVYQKAMQVALREEGLDFQAQKHLPIHFRGHKVGRGLVDLMVDEQIIVELKAVSGLHPQHIAQVQRYLSAAHVRRGLILNFGCPDNLEIKHVRARHE
ncbi:MAG TPA: GxxExxY protein [Acidobacteriota bacterium]|nr:GxxExxY protein [Acidobacteriota bacterium]